MEPDPPQRIKILGLQDWKYWKIGNTVRIGKKDWKKGIGGLDTSDPTRRRAASLGEFYVVII